MKFTYETQGAITYLVCELEPVDQVDGLTLGMITNNHIPGFAPVLYMEMNGQRYLKYNISAKISSDQFFSATMTKQRLLMVLQNILTSVCSADDYMIDQNCFALEAEHIFLNVSSCEVAMLCIPVVSVKDVNAEVVSLFRRILTSSKFDEREDSSYVSHFLDYLNSGNITVYTLKDFLESLKSYTPPAQQAQPQVNQTQPQVNQLVVQAPVNQQLPVPVQDNPSFEATMLMHESDDKEAYQRAYQNVAQEVKPQAPVAVSPDPQRMMATSAVVPPAPAPMQQPKPPVMAPPPRLAQMNMPPQNIPPAAVNTSPNVAPVNVRKEPPAPINQPPVNNKKQVAQAAPSFAIPGQSMGGAVPPAQPANVPVKNKKEPKNGEKKMTLFSLLSHYNKENAQLYKQQKEAAKAAKIEKAGNQPAPQFQPNPAPPTGVPRPVQQNPTYIPPMPPSGNQQFAAPAYNSPVQPVPVQNSFNETTILSPDMLYGETTILAPDSCKPDPRLIRVRTGEKISINKPVFRIGKERSYVDYFIADNGAISRSHANIHTENDEYFIEDTNSTNHTYVNGKVINSNVKIKIVDGDRVRLANEDFTFIV